MVSQVSQRHDSTGLIDAVQKWKQRAWLKQTGLRDEVMMSIKNPMLHYSMSSKCKDSGSQIYTLLRSVIFLKD